MIHKAAGRQRCAARLRPSDAPRRSRVESEAACRSRRSSLARTRSARSARSGRSAAATPARVERPRPASSMRPTGPRLRSIHSRTTGSDVRPHVELRVERARHAFDHHHGLLQHDELGAGRHVEQRRDLEQQRQQLRHRDLVGAAVVDRLADGANRLREILDRVMRAARSRPRNAPRRRAGSRGWMKPSRISARKRRSFMPSRPMMPKSTATRRPCRVDEQIAGMHVGVEEAVADRMAQEGLDDACGRAPTRSRPAASMAARSYSADAVDPFDRQHVARGQIPFGLRHAEIGVVLACSRRVPRGPPPRAAGPSRSRPSGPASRRPRPASGAWHRARCARTAGRRSAWPGDRARNCSRTPGRTTLTATSASPSRRAMRALCTWAMEAAAIGSLNSQKDLVDRAAERDLDHAHGLRARKGRHAVLQAFEVARRARRRRCRDASPGTGRT